MTYVERFIRAYAEKAVQAIEVRLDKATGVAKVTFYGRQVDVHTRDLVLQEDAFRRLAAAVNELLGIPPPADDHTEEP
jgi:hypothetical protein